MSNEEIIIVNTDIVDNHSIFPSKKTILHQIESLSTCILSFNSKIADDNFNDNFKHKCKAQGDYATCRICNLPSFEDDELINPCKCNDTIGYIHEKCLKDWIDSEINRDCQFVPHCTECQMQYLMQFVIKNKFSIKKTAQSLFKAFIILSIGLTLLSLIVYVFINSNINEHYEYNCILGIIIGIIGVLFIFGMIWLYLRNCKTNWYTQIFVGWNILSFQDDIFVELLKEKIIREKYMKLKGIDTVFDSKLRKQLVLEFPFVDKMFISILAN